MREPEWKKFRAGKDDGGQPAEADGAHQGGGHGLIEAKHGRQRSAINPIWRSSGQLGRRRVPIIGLQGIAPKLAKGEIASLSGAGG